MLSPAFTGFVGGGGGGAAAGAAAVGGARLRVRAGGAACRGWVAAFWGKTFACRASTFGCCVLALCEPPCMHCCMPLYMFSTHSCSYAQLPLGSRCSAADRPRPPRRPSSVPPQQRSFLDDFSQGRARVHSSRGAWVPASAAAAAAAMPVVAAAGGACSCTWVLLCCWTDRPACTCWAVVLPCVCSFGCGLFCCLFSTWPAGGGGPRINLSKLQTASLKRYGAAYHLVR